MRSAGPQHERPDPSHDGERLRGRICTEIGGEHRMCLMLVVAHEAVAEVRRLRAFESEDLRARTTGRQVAALLR